MTKDRKRKSDNRKKGKGERENIHLKNTKLDTFICKLAPKGQSNLQAITIFADLLKTP